jgi:hypothetical protein
MHDNGFAGVRAPEPGVRLIVGAERAFFMSEFPLADDPLSMLGAAASGGEGYKPPIDVPAAGADVPPTMRRATNELFDIPVIPIQLLPYGRQQFLPGNVTQRDLGIEDGK